MIAALIALLAVVNSPVNSVTYACDGTTAAYTVNFPYLSSSDLVVTSTTAGGIVTTLVAGTDFSVNLSSTPSTAALTLNSPATKCPSGSTFKIARNTGPTQPTSFRQQNNYDPRVHETAYDRATMLIQEGLKGVNAPLSGAGNVLSPLLMSQANATHSGFLSAADWSAFSAGPVGSNTYTAPFTGAVSRLVSGKLADTVSIKDGNVAGAGADERTAIQTVITNNANKRIVFPSGTYAVSGSLNAVSGTSLECTGVCTFQPFGGYTGNLFEINTVAKFHVRGGFVFTGAFNQIFHALSSTDILIQGVTVDASVAAPTTGIGDIGSSAQVRILDNRVVGTLGMGIDIEDSHDVIVSRNVILNVGQTILGGEGIAMRALVHPAFPNDMVVISDNIMEDCGKACIKVTVETLFNGSQGSFAGSQFQRVSVTGNTIHGWGTNVAESGIALFNHLCVGNACADEHNQAITVSGNVIESKGRITPAGCPGACTFPWELSYIDLVYVNDATVSGNIMRGGVTWGGVVLQNSHRVTLIGNVIENAVANFTATGGTGGVGAIELLGINAAGFPTEGSHYNTVVGNMIYNTGKVGDLHAGIYADQARFNTINSNVITDSTASTMSYGVDLAGGGAVTPDFNTVIGNVISGAVTLPIHVAFQSSNHVIANGGDWFKSNASLTYNCAAATCIIAHSLGVTPTRYILTPSSTLGAATKWWVAGVTAFNITINMDVNPGVNVNFQASLGAGNEF